MCASRWTIKPIDPERDHWVLSVILRSLLCPRYAAIPQGMLRTTQREVATFLFSSKEQPCLWYFFFHCITHCHIYFDIWAGKIRLISIVVLYLNRTAMQIILVERSIRRLSASVSESKPVWLALALNCHLLEDIRIKYSNSQPYPEASLGALSLYKCSAGGTRLRHKVPLVMNSSRHTEQSIQAQWHLNCQQW